MPLAQPSPRSLRSLLILLLIAGVGIVLVGWPIVAYDNDIFYHLAGGRYILEHFRLPQGPYFSFLPPQGTWVDYYWLHQVVLYSFFKLGGFAALSVFRAALFMASIWLVYRYLARQDQRQSHATTLLVLSLTIAYAMAIFPRDLLLRPHVFSYMAIVAFMIIINQRRRLGWLLPVIGVLWVNLHGVEYPVMLLICGAYLAEYFIPKFLRRPVPEELRQLRWPLIVTLYAVLATPAGTGLLLKPFASPLFQEQVINELRATQLGSLLLFSLYPVSNAASALGNLLIAFLVVSAAVLLFMRRIRPSRLILLAGGLVLLPQSRRFTYEFVLLLLPLAGDVLWAVTPKVKDLAWKAVLPFGLAMVGGMIAIVFAYLGFRPEYPLSRSNLPVGVCDFLEKEGPGGRILNEPNCGGYLVWRLYPKYSLLMDMETMLFTSYDFFLSGNFSNDKTVLKKMVDTYDPGFILCDTDSKTTPETLASLPQFVPVFLDDYAVLYADSTKYPELAGKYRIESLPVTGVMNVSYTAMEPEKRLKILAECRRLLGVYPESLLANAVAAKILLAEGHPEEAAPHAEALMRHHPQSSMGYGLGAQAAFAQGKFEAAVAYDLKALDRADPADAIRIRRSLYLAYVRLEQYAKAYETLKAVVNPMVWTTPAKDLYDLGLAAASSGRGREGLLLLDMARAKAPPEDADMIQDIEKYRARLSHALEK